MTQKYSKTVAFTGMKGGVGKSTLAINMAALLVERGRSVLLMDADPQQTASTWHAVAVEQGHPCPTLVPVNAANLHHPGQVPTFAKKFDHIIIDCPPRIGDVQRSALMAVDLVLYPTGPSTPDLWTLLPSFQELAEVRRRFRPNLRAALILNRVQARTSAARTVRATLTADLEAQRQKNPDIGDMPILQSELALRVAHSEAVCSGLGVTTYQPDSPAAVEVRALVDEILALQGSEAPTRAARGR